MQISLAKNEIDIAIKIYLESLGFSREDFQVTAKLVAGRSGNDGKIEVTLTPKLEPSIDRVKTSVEPEEALVDYREVVTEMKEDQQVEEPDRPVDPRKTSTTESYEIDTPEIKDIEEEEEF